MRHLPAHPPAVSRWDDLATVLRDPHYLEARAEAGEIDKLADDFTAALAPDAMPAAHPWRPILRLLEEALRRDLPIRARHPTSLFQCMWNTCWWYDCPDAAHHYDPPKGGWEADGPPWERPGPKLHEWMQMWRQVRESGGNFVWVRALRSPGVPLGGALRVTCTGHSECLPSLPQVNGPLWPNGLRLWPRNGRLRPHSARPTRPLE